MVTVKRKIILISDSPTISSGFARTTRIWATLLSELNYEVHCFGIGSWGNFHKKNFANYEVWAGGRLSDEHYNKFLQLYNHIDPDLIIINYELIRSLNWISFLQEVGISCKIICYLIVDGLPVFPELLKPLNFIDLIITTTNAVASFIKKYTTVKVVVFPHLVDKEFEPMSHVKDKKRTQFGDSPIIGIFAANNPRKQISSVLQAFKNLTESKFHCYLLIHTNEINTTRSGGDNLRLLIKYYSLENQVFITEADSSVAKKFSDNKKFSHKNFFQELNVVEQINSCDVIIIPTKFGGFEYSIIESQACGIPICVTNDNSIMKEIAGYKSHFLKPCMYEFTNYGAQSFLIRPSTIAKSVFKILNDKSYGETLVKNGFENVKKFYIKNNIAYFREIFNSLL